MLSHNAPRVEGGSGSDAPDTTADKVPTPPPTSTVLLPLGFQILPASRDRNASRNEITLTFPQLRSRRRSLLPPTLFAIPIRRLFSTPGVFDPQSGHSGGAITKK